MFQQADFQIRNKPFTEKAKGGPQGIREAVGCTEQARTIRDGAWGGMIRTKKPGGPCRARVGVSSLKAASEAGSHQSGGGKNPIKQSTKKCANWRQLMLTGQGPLLPEQEVLLW